MMNPELTWFVISYSYGEAALNATYNAADYIFGENNVFIPRPSFARV